MDSACVYRFYSRFDTDWSGLVWDRSFPVLLEKLLFGEGGVAVQDRRVLDAVQIVPARGGVVDHGGAEGVVDLAPVLWIAVVLLFILERVLSHGKRKT